MKKTGIVLLLALVPMFLQAQDASALLGRLVAKLDMVKDYSVNANIRSDMPMIKILPVNAKIYFKQKDKLKVVSEGIAILPRQGFTDISKLLQNKNSYTAFLTGTETIQNVKTDIITVLPSGDTSDVVLAKLWVDAVNDIVLKSQITTRSNGTVTIDYQYGAQKVYGLPDNITFTVDVKKFKIPKGVATDINKTSAPAQAQEAAKTGKIYIALSGYVINKGIDDAFFRK